MKGMEINKDILILFLFCVLMLFSYHIGILNGDDDMFDDECAKRGAIYSIRC